MLRTNYLRKESYEMHEERSYDHPSYYYDHRIHHDDGTLCWCGTIHVNKPTTLLRKKDVHQGVLGSKPILRPPLIGYQPNHHKTTTYFGGGGGAYGCDTFIGNRPYQHPGRAFEHDGFIDRSHQHQLGGGGAYEYGTFIGNRPNQHPGWAFEHDGVTDRSHDQHSLGKGHHMEGFGTRVGNLDGHDLVEKAHELESLIKDMELNRGGRGGGVKVIELVQVQRTRTYGQGFGKQWKTSSIYCPSNGHLFSINY